MCNYKNNVQDYPIFSFAFIIIQRDIWTLYKEHPNANIFKQHGIRDME